MTFNPSSSTRVHLATIGAPFGVKGAFRLKSLTENPKNVLAYGPLFDATGKVYEFHVVRVEEPSTLIVRESSVLDRTMAEHLRGTKLYLEKKLLPSSIPTEKSGDSSDHDIFYQHELVGLRALNEKGELVGEVTTVENYGASDILIIKTKDGLKQLPFIKDAVPHVDSVLGAITIVEAFLL